jgi:hypothetical protein
VISRHGTWHRRRRCSAELAAGGGAASCFASRAAKRAQGTRAAFSARLAAEKDTKTPIFALKKKTEALRFDATVGAFSSGGLKSLLLKAMPLLQWRMADGGWRMGFVGWLWWVMRLPPRPRPRPPARSPGQRVIEGPGGGGSVCGGNSGQPTAFFWGRSFALFHRPLSACRCQYSAPTPSPPPTLRATLVGSATLPCAPETTGLSSPSALYRCSNGSGLSSSSGSSRKARGRCASPFASPPLWWAPEGTCSLLGRRPLSLKLPAAQLPGMPEGSHFFFCVPEVPAVPAAYIWSQIALRADR